MAADLNEFCALQKELLKLEQEAETAQSVELFATESNFELQSRGIALLGLVVDQVSCGLFSKTIATFNHHLARIRRNPESVHLPPTTISSGDIVGVFADSFQTVPILTGVVHAIDVRSLKIVLDDAAEILKLPTSEKVNVARIGSNVTHNRLMHTVTDLGKSHHRLVRHMFGAVGDVDGGEDGHREGCLTLSPAASASNALNDPQRIAVANSLSNSLITLIHGPPGTGKTTTLSAIIAELVSLDPNVKIIACAPSNVATDNLAIKVLEAGVRNVVRVGHPARVKEGMLEHTLDALVAKSDFTEACKDIREEIQTILDSRRNYDQLRPLRSQLRERETKAIEQVTLRSNVVFTTCNGAFNIVKKLLPTRQHSFLFDVCVIDECAQGLEISSWIPILQSRRVILGGDHHQLSATVISEEALRRGLNVTLFDRCQSRFANSPSICNLLTMQYRMHAIIMGWSNEQFYSGKLIADPSVSSRTLEVKKTVFRGGVDVTSILESPFVFCDTVGVDGMAEDGGTESKSNLGEVGIVKTYVELLHEAGFENGAISIISPYLKQKELIRSALENRSCEVSTVDSFQGRESDVIVISLVRSNSQKSVGFLSDYRRLNVAVTRAKRQVYIIGNSETIVHDPVLRTLFEYASQFGTVVSGETFKSDQPEFISRSEGTGNVMQKKVRSALPAKLARSSQASPGPISAPDTDTRGEFESVLKNLQPNQRLAFPPTLNTAHRRLVHGLCERIGLSHGSTGEGSERFVWAERRGDGVGIVTQGSEPPTRVSLSVAPPTIPQVPKPAPKPAPKPMGICPHLTCAMSVKVISVSCQFCLKDFCVGHAMAEIHGCGDTASREARKGVKKELNRLKSGVPGISSGKGGVSTEALRKKMDSKMSQMKQNRSAK